LIAQAVVNPTTIRSRWPRYMYTLILHVDANSTTYTLLLLTRVVIYKICDTVLKVVRPIFDCMTLLDHDHGGPDTCIH